MLGTLDGTDDFDGIAEVDGLWLGTLEGVDDLEGMAEVDGLSLGTDVGLIDTEGDTDLDGAVLAAQSLPQKGPSTDRSGSALKVQREP